MLVVDASVLAPALASDLGDGGRARERLIGATGLAAPELVDLEVVSVLRRQHRAGSLDRRRAELALADLSRLGLRRVAHRLLLARCWSLRDNLSAYDAAYVAVAEMLGAVLLTADARLARAPGLRCEIEVLG